MSLTLDHIDHCELSDGGQAHFGSELATLSYLQGGLHYLAKQVAAVETEVQGRIDPRLRVFSVGNDPQMRGLPLGLVNCAFHWYAVSACNYVRMVGWLLHEDGAMTQKPGRYLSAVIPEVKAWRDKVGAHFARAHGNKHDSEAERLASVFPPVGFDDDVFIASPLTLTMTRGGRTSTSSALRPWSLTKVHARLGERYWPVLSGDASA